MNATIEKIVNLLIAELSKRLQDKQLSLKVTKDAIDCIIERGYDPVYGARPLKRYIQHTLETMLAKRILSGDLTSGATLIVDVDENGLTVK